MAYHLREKYGGYKTREGMREREREGDRVAEKRRVFAKKREEKRL